MKKLLSTIQAFITRHIIAKEPESNYNDKDISEFQRFVWDCRVELSQAKTHCEVESCYWDIDWIEDTFRGRVHPDALHFSISSLYHLYSAKRTALHKVS